MFSHGTKLFELLKYSNVFFGFLVRESWWGSRRVDYIVYCPESLMSQPAHVLPIVFHSSYWESRDVIAFILRKVDICFFCLKISLCFLFLSRRLHEIKKPIDSIIHKKLIIIDRLLPDNQRNDGCIEQRLLKFE